MATQTQDDKINTSHAYFLKRSPNPSQPPISLILRGVNLSSTSKFPKSSKPSSTASPSGDDKGRKARDELRQWQAGTQTHIGEEGGFWRDGEAGGSDGWFVGHPLQEEGIDVHLRRLRAWGFGIVRLIVTWESLEHAGPGKYDETYINYLLRILERCKVHGFKVFISPHQDVFSRYLSGSGAPYWVLLAVGLNPRRLHQTGSAVVHAQWATEGYGGIEGIQEAEKGDFSQFPDMIWNTNLHRLASRHCFTMFFASEKLAPKCVIDDQPVSAWLQDKYNAAYGHLADRIRETGGLLDTCVIGWDSMNEPHEGFIGIPGLNEIPPTQDFRKGPSPSPIQGFQLGVGRSVEDIAYDDFTSLGHKKLGKITITPPNGEGVWLTRDEAKSAEERWGWKWGPEWDFWNLEGEAGCPWGGHNVWNKNEGIILQPSYFQKDAEGKEYDYLTQFWKPQYESYIRRIRRSHPDAISFLNPPIFESPPDLSEDVKGGRIALSSHFYDGLTMLGKRRHKFNANAVGLQRGQIGMFDALKVGTSNIRSGLRSQFEELKSDASKQEGIAADESGKKEYPTLIGELGVPFDMKETRLLGLARGKEDRKDYKQPAKAMDELLNGCDGENGLSYTLWCYEPTNTHAQGDGWNGEDLSLFSYDDLENDDDLVATDPPDLRSLITLGARGIESWCRPYPVEAMGRIKHFSFDMASTTFELRIEVVSLEGSRLWQADRAERGAEHDSYSDIEKEGSALIFLPFVHYVRTAWTDEETTTTSTGTGRLLGSPGGDGEWFKGEGEALVDLEILEITEGRLEVNGQWGRWYYPLREKGDREVYLKLRHRIN